MFPFFNRQCSVYIPLAGVLLLLSSCSGGSAGGSNNEQSISGHGNKVYITVTPQALSYVTFKSNTGVNRSIEKKLHVTFEGEGVLVGYAPNIPKASWLGFSDSEIVAPTKEFDFSLYANAQFLSPGTYDTSLRLVTGYIDGSDTAYVDIPIHFVIEPTPPIYEGSIEFSSSNKQTVDFPVDQSITLDVGVLDSGVLSASLKNTNSEISEWLTLTVNQDRKELLLSVTNRKPAGSYHGEVFVSYEFNGGTAEKAVPVSLNVAAEEAKIHYAVPPALFVNDPIEIIIRGVGFLSTTIEDVVLNTSSTTSFKVVNDSEIRAQFAAENATGDATLRVSTAGGQLSAPKTILIKQKPQAIAGVVEFASGVMDYEIDTKRDAVVVATADTLYRVSVVNGNWQTIAQRPLVTTEIELTPDSDGIFYTDNTSLYLLDAVTLETITTYPLPYIRISSGAGFYNSVALKNIANNGDILLVISDDSGTNLNDFKLSVFHLPNQTLTVTDHAAASALTDTDLLRQNILIAPNYLS